MLLSSLIDSINVDLLSKAESILPQWFPGGKWNDLRYGVPYNAPYTRRDGTKGELTIFTQKAVAGVWYDRGVLISGKGFLKLYAYKEHIPGWNDDDSIQAMNEAAKRLGY